MIKAEHPVGRSRAKDVEHAPSILREGHVPDSSALVRAQCRRLTRRECNVAKVDTDERRAFDHEEIVYRGFRRCPWKKDGLVIEFSLWLPNTIRVARRQCHRQMRMESKSLLALAISHEQTHARRYIA
jgi:hypothetical protein